MNGLTLRINGGTSKKAKGSLLFNPIIISDHLKTKTDEESKLYRKFNKSQSVDEQLTILKEYLNDGAEIPHSLLVKAFLHAVAKHPVKCFIARYITKNHHLQEAFSKILTTEILANISVDNVDCKKYSEFVPKLASCIENFPTGCAAIRDIDIIVADYLTKCLQHCIDTLRTVESLSPTEKNEIYDLTHLSLRLILNIIQKMNEQSIPSLKSMFNPLRDLLKALFFDDDVPMDTKSVSGIVFVSLFMLEYGPNSWIKILLPSVKNCDLMDYFENDSAKLSIYFALITVVPEISLYSEKVNEESGLIILTNNILDIGESTITNSTFTLGVTRTLVQISKALPKAPDSCLGVKLVDCLLIFVWSHLEHYMDSVRHLTAQILSNIVKYCTALKKQGDDKALNKLFEALSCLDQSRKSYYVSLTSLVSELGASCIMQRISDVIRDIINALAVQAVQASATTTLETLLQKHSKESTSEIIYNNWVIPILDHVTNDNSDSAVLNILENLLLLAMKLNEDLINYLLPHIKKSSDRQCDLKCTLMLLSVARKSNVETKLESEDEWRGLVSHEFLQTAASDAADEVRALCLSLIVESRKTTEAFTNRELELVRNHLAYNANAQQPDARQQTLALIKKFIKRLEDSHKVLRRQKIESDYYLTFLEGLREMCYGFLIPGVNYSRRYVSLQVLVWCEHASFETYQRTWKPEYVLNLLHHLEDSYESNKAFALDILQLCPVELIESHKTVCGLELGEILKLASSVKPTDCVSAAYKSRLVASKLPETALQGRRFDIPEVVNYFLLSDILKLVKEQLSICRRSIVLGARGAAMYGALHCALHVIDSLDAGAISKNSHWSNLIEEMISTCFLVNEAVECVVNNPSPEGHLPMDMSGVLVTDHGNSGNVTLEDGRPVTAQMVLLCAWRSVKEVSLLLGSISSRLTIEGEGQEYATLNIEQMLKIGVHFTKLLAETKHRGAFEQAYVGFTKVLSRLWRCRNEFLHELPRAWLRGLLQSVAGEAGEAREAQETEEARETAVAGVKKYSSGLCPTRRSAGLPFMIQALVTTELVVSEQPKCFQECLTALMGFCSANVPQIRAHACNVLRALVRCSQLHQHIAPYVGDALVLALRGFEANTWEERNACTLLLSALSARAFGGSRVGGNRVGGRGGGRVTGRLFFLRYPQLYDFMLEKLTEASQCGEVQTLKPSLYPILLMLGKLYPSALEGTVSNLKLCGLARPVASCANSASVHTRRLAARALAPLVSPHTYIPHIEESLNIIADENVKKNLCHGLLLQITTLLENKPDNLIIDEESSSRLKVLIHSTMWILKQYNLRLPCYLLIDEYTKVLNLLIWSFPNLIDPAMLEEIIVNLDQIIFKNDNDTKINCGKEICLANATSLYIIISNKYRHLVDIKNLIYKTLSHSTYEVILASMDYLLILNKELDIETKFHEHLKLITQDEDMSNFKTDTKYTETLYEVLKSTKYLECRYKCLKLLSLEERHEYVIENQDSEMSDDIVISNLISLINSAHEKLTHIYLYSLSSFISKKLKNSNIVGRHILETLRTIFACSSSENNDYTRSVVVEFLESNFKTFINLEFSDLTEGDKFELQATLWATLVTVLEDDERNLRERCSRVASAVVGNSPAVGSLVGQRLRRYLAKSGIGFLSLLALLDFRCQVCLTDDGEEECRVFDQNEKYNVFLEETVWMVACADEIKQLCQDEDICKVILKLLEEPTLKPTFQKLCGSNVEAFKNMIEGSGNISNPKVELFVKELNIKGHLSVFGHNAD